MAKLQRQTANANVNNDIRGSKDAHHLFSRLIIHTISIRNYFLDPAA